MDSDNIERYDLVSSHMRKDLPILEKNLGSTSLIISQGLNLPVRGSPKPPSPGISCNSV